MGGRQLKSEVLLQGEIVDKKEVPDDLLTSEENMLFSQFKDEEDVNLRDIFSAASKILGPERKAEALALAKKVNRLIMDARFKERQILLDENRGIRGIARQRVRASEERLRSIKGPSPSDMPSEPPSAM